MSSIVSIPISWLTFSLGKSALVFATTIGGVSQEQAGQLTDGPDGWSILEIMCHVRDYQEIFIERVERMINEDNPTLTPVDAAAREALIVDNRYAEQDLLAVYQDYASTRKKFIEYVASLADAQLERPGINPLRGEIDVLTEIYHAIMHDIDHAEQIVHVRGVPMP